MRHIDFDKKKAGNMKQICKTTRIVDSDGSIYVWSYDYRYLARWSERKLQKCIEVAKCFYLPTQNCRPRHNSAKPAPCSKNIKCFVRINDAVEIAPLKRAPEQQNSYICDTFRSDCPNQRLAAKWQGFCLTRQCICRKLKLQCDSANPGMYRPKL